MTRAKRAKAPEPTRAEAFRTEVRKLKPGAGPGELVLLEEACRLIDRSDRLAALLAGERDAWATVEWPFEEAPAVLVVGSVLTEARSTAAELRQVVKALDLPKTAEVAKASGLDELERRRQRA